MSASLPSRYLALHFPYLSTDRLKRLRHAKPGEPLVTIEKYKSAWRLAALDEVAQALGLEVGLPLADARARFPNLQVIKAEPDKDHALLEALADWCLRYTPLTALSEAGGLMFDITGCAHLFGGEVDLRADLCARLKRQSLKVKAAIASTVGVAWAAAHYSRYSLVPAGREAEFLDSLPLAALRLPSKILDALERLGLRSIADVQSRPRAPLTARFGPELLQRLDQALGLLEEPISPRLPLPVYSAQRRFADPIAREEDVRAVTLSLIKKLCISLEKHGEGALHLRLHLFRADGMVKHLEASLSRATREPRLLQEVLMRRLEAIADEIDPGFGFDCLIVSIGKIGRCDIRPTALLDEQKAPDITPFIDAMSARLGKARVQRLNPHDSHIPEHAQTYIPAQNGVLTLDWNHHLAEEGEPPTRPIRLFAHPEPIETIAAVPDGPPIRFRWRRVLPEVARVDGPERIASEWWRDENHRALTRDYYRVEDKEGRRFWLFRNGLFSESEAPRWFMHGLFA